MFNIILTLAAGILIGWNFHAFFISLSPPKILRKEFNLSIQATETLPPKEMKKEFNKSVITKTSPPTFNNLLDKNLFSKALKLFKESNEGNRSLYRERLHLFFEEKINNRSKEATLELNHYLKIEPENTQARLQLIEAYNNNEEYAKAIETIRVLSESSDSAIEQDRLNQRVIQLSKIYIDALNKAEKFQQLIDFLEKEIEIGTNSEFFTFNLGKFYAVTKKEYPLATKLLKEIEFDETYGEKAKALLQSMEKLKKENNNTNYTYKFPLEKKGEHFILSVSINDTPLKLLLDTGASRTLIDEELIPSLISLNRELTLQTAGGLITSKVKEAHTFKIEELEIKEFQLLTAPFKNRKADGLLGMDFLKKFTFKIDQEKHLLYLSYKTKNIL